MNYKFKSYLTLLIKFLLRMLRTVFAQLFVGRSTNQIEIETNWMIIDHYYYCRIEFHLHAILFRRFQNQYRCCYEVMDALLTSFNEYSNFEMKEA